MTTIEELNKPSLVVKINKTFRDGMSNDELYEIIRGIWKIHKDKRDKIQYVFGVYHGTIIEVYKVSYWDDAGKTPYKFRKHDAETLRGRSEFVGSPADDIIRDRFVGKKIELTYQTINYYNC